jgi:hypothetical protein
MHDRSLICYEDFCRSLEANGASEFGAHEYGSTRRELEQSGVGNRLRSVLGDGYDGTNTRRSNSYGNNNSNSNPTEDSFGRTRSRGGYDDRDRGGYDDQEQEQRGGGGHQHASFDQHTPRERFGESARGRSSYDRDYSSTHDRGSLLPPKPSDSVTRLRAGNTHHAFNTSSSFDSGR